MNRELITVIEQIGREKGIDKEILLKEVESALLAVWKKKHPTADNVRIEIDRRTGQQRVYLRKTIVEEVNDPEIEIGHERGEREPEVETHAPRAVGLDGDEALLERPPVARAQRGVEHRLKRVHDVVGGERAAIGEAQALAERRHPGEIVLGLQRLRQVEPGLERRLVDGDEARHHEARDLGLVAGEREARVELAGLGLVHDHDDGVVRGPPHAPRVTRSPRRAP